MKRLFRLQYNAPVTLTFALVSLAALLLGKLTNGWTDTYLFSVWHSSLSDLLTYPRFFLHVLGHVDYDHYIGNMMMILDHGIHIAQMMSPEEIQDDLDLVTTNGAITMHIQDRYGIEEGKPANFIVLDAKSEFDAICERADILASVRKGEYLFQKEPAKVIGAIDLLK